MEKLIIFLMGVTICFISYKWYMAVKKNKELVQGTKSAGGGVGHEQDENKQSDDNQMT